MPTQFSRWLRLLLLSVLLATAFDYAAVPAARLLGPMVAAIALAVRGSGVRMARGAFVAAQGIVGCLIAHSMPAASFGALSGRWPLFLVGLVSVTVLANGLGWLLARWKTFPGATAIWGSAPGAASAMLILAEAHGEDIRLVAFMQYLRVVCVCVTASAVAHWWILASGAAPPAAASPAALLQPPGSWAGLAATLAVGLGGAVLGLRLRIPAGALLLPLGAGIALQDGLGIPLELPPLLLAAAYAAIGWTIGMRFDRPVLALCIRSLPRLLASTFVLIALCALVGAALVRWAGLDPLTAYLATSPGGADVIAIVAAASPVDAPFVIAMQVLRTLFVLLTGPAIARMLARRIGARGA